MTYYAPKDQIDQIDYAKETGLKILAYFEEYFNVTYPLPKAGKFVTFRLLNTLNKDNPFIMRLQCVYIDEN